MTIANRFRRRQLIATLALAALAAGAAATTAGAIRDPEKFTGGGFVGNPDIRVSLGLNLSCAATGPGSELQINWFNPQPDPPGREAFHLEMLEEAVCDMGDPANRNDGGTHAGAGTGTCKTQAGSSAPAKLKWSLTDGGIRDEVNRPDSLQLDMSSELPACNLQVAGPLEGGNFGMSKVGIGDEEN